MMTFVLHAPMRVEPCIVGSPRRAAGRPIYASVLRLEIPLNRNCGLRRMAGASRGSTSLVRLIPEKMYSDPVTDPRTRTVSPPEYSTRKRKPSSMSLCVSVIRPPSVVPRQQLMVVLHDLDVERV